MGKETLKSRYWQARELVVIGVFAATAKLSSLLIALAGGGMNPVSLVLKNLVFTTLLIILLTKVPKPGTLLVFTVVSQLVSVTLLGGRITLIPGSLIAACVAEVALYMLKAHLKDWGAMLAAFLHDLISKAFSLGMSFLFMRESPALMSIVVPIVVFGYAGSLAGLFCARLTVKELRHAGFVR